MSINIIDICILLFILLGAVIGFKRGIIQSVVMLVGTIAVILIAWYLKNPLSEFLYKVFPFIKFGGDFTGVSVINILIYESIAFFIVFALLSVVLRIIIRITGVVEKILKYTIVLGIPSKILGAIFGAVEAFVFVFVILFVFSRFGISSSLLKDSKYTNQILNKTPILSSVTKDANKSFDEIYDLKEVYKDNKNKDEFNLKALDILLKYEVVTKDTAKELVNKGKITTNGAMNIIEKYEAK